MTQQADFRDDLLRWVEGGEAEALARLQTALRDAMYAPPAAVDSLGAQAVDDVRRSVVSRLLMEGQEQLFAANKPLAYARQAWRNALTSELRKWGPRPRRADEVREHERLRLPDDRERRVEDRVDAEIALRIAGSLSGKGRLAVLLLVRPRCIADEDWQRLVENLPPPPPERPLEPVDKETASRWLFPPLGPETAAQRRQRLNSFDKTWRRALTRIRDQLETT